MVDKVFYTIVVGTASGIFIRSLYVSPLLVPSVLALCALPCLLSWATNRRYVRAFLLGIACLTGAFGMVRYEVSTWNDHHPYLDVRLDREVVLVGEVVTEPDVRAQSTNLTVRTHEVDDVEIDALILVRTDRFPSFSYGDVLRVTGTLTLPEPFDTDLGRTFDYPGYLSARGITYVLSFADTELIERDAGLLPLALLLEFKHAFMQSVESLLPEPSAGLAEGLLLGVKRALGEDLEEAFRTVGIIHIVVLSGYNVTIVAEAIMRLLSFWGTPRTRAMFGMVAIAAFAFIAGLSATVLRASLMAGLVLVARATGRTYDVVRALCVAGLAMLLFNPKLLVFDPGFQLSFVATLGLILLAPLIEARLSLVPTRFQIREFLTATVSTQIFVLPLLLYAIGELSLIAVVVNVLVLPAVPFAMLMTFLAGVIGWVSATAALPVAFAAHLSLAYIIGMAERFAALPFAAVAVPPFPFWVVLVAYGAMGYGMYRALKNNTTPLDEERGGVARSG